MRALTIAAILCASVANLPAQGRITGTVFDSLITRAPLRGSVVTLVATGRYAVADDRGRFAFDSVLPGRYSIGFMHPVLDSLDVYVPPIAVELPNSGRVSVALATPSPAALYSTLCPGPHEEDTGVLVGRVRDVESETPLADAAVGTSWTEILFTAGGREDRRRGLLARTDREGAFRLCGVPTRLMLDVRAELGGFRAGPLRLALDTRLFGHANLAVSRGVPSVGPAANEPRRVLATGSVHGTVRDRSGRAVRDAIVALLDESRTVRTNATGEFRFDSVPAGTRTLEARKIGAPPTLMTIDLHAHEERDATLTIDRSAQALTAVTIVGTRTTPLIERAGFTQRRRMGLGAFFTAEDIARLGSFDLSDVLGRMSGLQLSRIGGDFMPTMRRANGTICIPTFFVDGFAFPVDGARAGKDTMAPFTDLSSLLLPHMVRGIEVYANLGSIPLEYDRTATTGCGSVLIWTH